MGFVFKQRYVNSANVPVASIPGLNVRHLQYIATRPGAIYNKECGFSLFGTIDPHKPAGDFRDLEAMKQLVRSESERGRTMFRAIVSLGEPDAGDRSYYDRQKWEALIRANISGIAKGMHIAPADLRWCAAMHDTKGHPHVHILFWDGGAEPRKDFIPKEKFEAFASSVRVSLNRWEYGLEIKEVQKEQAELTAHVRDELHALFLDTNPDAVFPIPSMLGRTDFRLVQDAFVHAVRNAPRYGSLRYAYLPEEYKAEIDRLLAQIKRLPHFAAQYQKYLEAAAQVAALYGNDEKTTRANVDKAVDKLDRALKNELLTSIRSALDDVREQSSQAPQRLQDFVRQQLERFAEDPQYRALLSSLPSERIPHSELCGRNDFQLTETVFIDSVLHDAVCRQQLYSSISDHVSREDRSATEAEINRDFAREARRQFTEQVRQDMGYAEEAAQTQTLSTLLRVFSLLSRSTGQSRAQGRCLQRSRDLSKDARRDRQQKESQNNSLSYD